MWLKIQKNKTSDVTNWVGISHLEEYNCGMVGGQRVGAFWKVDGMLRQYCFHWNIKLNL